MSPVGYPADRWPPNLTVTDTVLAAIQSDRGDVFSRQTGVCDASHPWSGTCETAFCPPEFLILRLMNLASCAGRLMPAMSSPGMLVWRAATWPLYGLISPKDGCASIAWL